MSDTEAVRVRRFREILLWPVQLMPLQESAQIQRHWERLGGADCVWQEVADEFTLDPAEFKERHYIEFSAFLPYVQRFLYGEGAAGGAGPSGGMTGYGASPIRVFRRRDVASARITLSDGVPLDVEVIHMDLYFFHDVDVAILAVEIAAEDVELSRVLDLMYRFGRTYPSFWNADGSAGQCCKRVEWLAADGTVLASSDTDDKAKYLAFVCKNRAPYIAAHWAFLLKPLALYHSEETGELQYRQLEYQRMPLLAYLSMDDPTRLTRADWVRLGLATGPGAEEGTLPFAESFLYGFEQRYCYDRYWNLAPGCGLSSCRMICCGHALVMVGRDGDPFFTDLETGLLGQFRHQYFLLGLIAHFHRAALLMMSDRLVVAVSRLDITSVESVKLFKRAIRQLFEIFLRFTHRYWFHEVSNQGPARDLFRMWSEHLGTARLFAEVRDEVQDMSDYLDSDGLRRQANSVLRLTVVTVVGLIGTLVTGFLGMNLLAMGDEPLAIRILVFVLTLVPTVALILLSVIKSKQLADFLEALSDDRLPLARKLGPFGARRRDRF
ncbi:CorA family divalent cation transporter [Azospirillum sp. sgz301742]